MKKVLKYLIALTLIIAQFPSTLVSAEEDDEYKKSRLMSYGMYTAIYSDENIEVLENISHLSYQQIHDEVEAIIIDKLTPNDNETIIWDSKFVLELVPIEYPHLYDELYNALVEQGYSDEEGIDGRFSPNISNISKTSNNTRTTTTYSYSYPSTYNEPGHGTMIISRSDMEWTITNGIINITYIKANYLGGWSLLFANATRLDNNTSIASGFFSYTVLESPLLYQAYLQTTIKPKVNEPGGCEAYILTRGVNLTSGYYP